MGYLWPVASVGVEVGQDVGGRLYRAHILAQDALAGARDLHVARVVAIHVLGVREVALVRRQVAQVRVEMGRAVR